MSTPQADDAGVQATAAPADRRHAWFATGGATGAIFASICCIAPLALLMLGVSGAWIGHLTALEPYKPVFAGGALLFIGLGFWQVYGSPRAACRDASACAHPRALPITKTVLWLSVLLVGLSLTIGWWAPLFY